MSLQHEAAEASSVCHLQLQVHGWVGVLASSGFCCLTVFPKAFRESQA